MAMNANGEEKVLAVARYIARTLGRTDAMSDDILQVFSALDIRFTLDNLASDAGHVSRRTPPLTSDERTVRSLDRQLSRFIASDLLIWSDPSEAAAFLEAVDDLLATIDDLEEPQSSGSSPGANPLLHRADELLQRCMLRLEEEFRDIVGRSADLSSSATGRLPHLGTGEGSEADNRVPDDVVTDGHPSGSIEDLHRIASSMVRAGFGQECAETYGVARRAIVDESVARLDFRLRPVDEVHAMPWPELEEEITVWIKDLRTVFLNLIPGERRLCDRVFASLPTFADLAFAGACRPAATRLLSFADAVASGVCALDRLFRIIDMYEAVRDLLPELEPVFTDEVRAIYVALGASIRGIITELENLIRQDPAKPAVTGGGLHPITRYVMNYLRAACISRRTLEEVMAKDIASAAVAATTEDDDPLHPPSSSLSSQVAWIMDVLQANLEDKSKAYRDPSLASIFLLNNGRYIVEKSKDGELAVLLGDGWLRRHLSLLSRWESEYQRVTWTKVICLLRTDTAATATESASSSASLKTTRERLRMFNAYLEEIWRVQAGWVVPDGQLRSELRAAAMELVLPAYRNFVARLSQAAERYLKYGVEDVEDKIDELFDGAGRR